MSIEAINALHQRIRDLAASSTPDQLAYLAKALESIIDKKATFSVEQMTEVKEVIDALQKRVKDLAANSTPDQLAYLAKALESIVDKSSVSEIVQMTDEKLKELLSAARSHLDEINSNKENSISAITAAKTESVDEINTLRTNSLAALKESSNSHISLLDTRKNANIAAINSVSNTHKEGLKSLVEDFRAVNNVPPGSSIIREIETRDNQLKTSIINEVKTRDDQLKTSLTNDVRTRDDQLKAYLINEIRKRNMIESGSLPFLFGILSRYNEGHWSNDDNGYFKAELGKWYKDTTQTDYMLQLLAGSNTYDYCTYSGFYRPPQLYFLQGNNGKFLYREEFMRRNHLADQKNYPYALLGVIFVKNTTNSNKSRTLYFSGSSHWSSGYEGAGLFVGVPSHVNTSKSATSGITWTNVYNYSSSSAAFSSSNNITVPANKTVAILFYTSPFYQTPGSNYYVWFMRWSIYSFRSSFLTTGLEVDVERTLKAWQCPGLSNTYEIWR